MGMEFRKENTSVFYTQSCRELGVKEIVIIGCLVIRVFALANGCFA